MYGPLDNINRMVRENQERTARIAESIRRERVQELENLSIVAQNSETTIKLLEATVNVLNERINSANRTLDCILNSLGANSQKTQEQIIETNKLLAELKTLIEIDKEGNKLRKFLGDHGIESIALITQIIFEAIKPK